MPSGAARAASSATAALDGFHPAVARWFRAALGAPTEAQAAAWPAIARGEHTLIAAPTGSGKTLAALLAALDGLVRDGLAGRLEESPRVVYVSPLKALSVDIDRNLQRPLAGIAAELEREGLAMPELRTAVRTGDTPARERAAMTRRPPQVLVTTPESLYILVTSERGRAMLGGVRTVIVDEIHAMIGDKRGAHLALTLERLDALLAEPATRVGLSATQKPIEEVARFLVGCRDGAPRSCTVIDTGHRRALDLALVLPSSPLEAVMAGEVWEEVYDRLAALVREHRTTLIFVNTRRLAERLARHLGERLGEAAVAAHHGSLARERRQQAERRLSAGELRALVATASLELGIDVGEVELVCQLGATRSISTLVQRVGRSGHRLGVLPKGRLFPLSRDDLVECVALLDAIGQGELDRLELPSAPLDVLAQQIVAEAAASDGCDEAELFARFRQAHPFRELGRERWDAVVAMLSQGFSTRRGRRGARLHHDAVGGRVRGRRGARMLAMTNAGTIPELADYDVVLDPSGERLGSVNEDFAIESMAGDIFQLGNTSWKILRVESSVVRVEDARGQPPSLPFWLGEAPARSEELSAAVSRLRARLDALLGEAPPLDSARLSAAIRDVAAVSGVGSAAAAELVEYIAAGRVALGVVPTQQTLVLERFFDDSGGMQLVLHAPFGARLNRAWGLSLRKRFCQRFDFELQAAATDDAIVLSLGATHSFPLEEVFAYLRAETVRDVLIQAMLPAPMFGTRWRWNATRALAVLRWRGGKKVPPRLQRMDADDLVSVVFPDQLACLDNLPGRREVPDHPLVEQTVQDCLSEAMDLERFERLLASVARGERRLVARDLTEPSPFARAILSARPYAFLDDAPLEERRTRAVSARRSLDPGRAEDLGALDAEAIERVRREAFAEPLDADELHDALCVMGSLTEEEGRRAGWDALFDALMAAGRATRVVSSEAGGLRRILWAPAERLGELLAADPGVRPEPPLAWPGAQGMPAAADAARELVRGRLEVQGPVTVAALGGLLGLAAPLLEAALLALEVEGFALRGRFTPGVREDEWCDRRLLARIHRLTLERLRREIEPVSQQDFMRFLTRWQHLGFGERKEGPVALEGVLAQLEGFAAAALTWESDLLPSRLAGYEPAWLDALCLSGRVQWTRLGQPAASGVGSRRSASVRGAPLAIVSRSAAAAWRSAATSGGAATAQLGADAAATGAVLERRGACFFDDLARETRLLPSQLEAALGELVAAGLVASDAMAGLRALLVPAARRGGRAASPRHRGRRRDGLELFGMQGSGRWALLPEPSAQLDEADVEHIARTLLCRYGVVARKLLAREVALPPWRELLRVYRRLEARGELRGGRFVAGLTGEQYALPEAVEALRETRRTPPTGELVSLSASDPLNLVGVLLPGERLAALSGARLLLRDGVCVARKLGGRAELLLDGASASERTRLLRALEQRVVPVGSVASGVREVCSPGNPG